MGDIGTLICTMMEAQSAAQVAMLVASNANMIAFHIATAQALAAKNGDKDSKLTVAKKIILQACCGQADKDTLMTPGVYMDMKVEGGTTDALGQILQQRMKTIVGSPHKSNIYVTPQLVATINCSARKWGQNLRGMHQGHDHLWYPVAVGRNHE